MKSLARLLGTGWSARGERLVYAPLKLAFRLVPGGARSVGLTKTDAAAARALADEEVRSRIKAGRPKRVVLPPFLLAETVLPTSDALGVPPAQVKRVIGELAAHALRVPTPEEWEAAARGGTDALFPNGTDALPEPGGSVSGFGHVGMGALAEWCGKGTKGGGLLVAP